MDVIPPTGRTVAVNVTDSSSVGECRRVANALSRLARLSETMAGKAAIIATEVANNIVKHAGGRGELLMRELNFPFQGLEILGIDHGPGMISVNACSADGFSTSGTPGTGLGAIQRLATFSDIYSVPGKGTLVLAQVTQQETTPLRRSSTVGGVCLPYPGQPYYGDTWRASQRDGADWILVADGLGHGQTAQTAADTAAEIFNAAREDNPAMILQLIHDALRSTRGAAAAVLKYDPLRGIISYSGVGNIAAAIVDDRGIKHLVSHNGTLGAEARKFQQFDQPVAPDGLVILHSDGLSSRWEFQTFPGIRERHPSMTAGYLYSRFKRGRDDVTVVAMRCARR